MLSPVSPVSAADLSFQTPAPRQETTPPAAAALALSQVESDVANLGAAANLRAVSGELQLSQNAGVLAETLGKLLNIARMDGEAAETYVNRLVETMQSLPADQRATLERQLGSVLRGITLSILADVLRSSAGPEAARLAIMFELARSSPTSRDAKPSISSYLQDMMPDSPVIMPVRTNAAPVPGRADAPILANGTPELEGPIPAIIKEVVGNKTPVKQPILPPTQSADPAFVRPVVTPTSSNGMTPARQVQQPYSGFDQIQPLPKTAPFPATAYPQILLNVGNEAIAPATNPTLPAQSAMLAKAILATNPEFEDATAAQRLQPEQSPKPDGRSLTAAITNQFSAMTTKEMEALLVAVLLGKVTARGETTALPVLALTSGEPDGENATKYYAPLPTPAHIKPAETAQADIQLSSARPEIAEAHKAAIVADIKAAILDQPTLQAAVAAMIAKEGTALPFVNYPAAKDEQESDAPPRGRWPSSEGNSEENETGGEGGEQPEQGSAQEERTAANDENIDHSLSEGANDDGATGNAESYYLKMSGFS